jgi:hypothetical protein
MENTAAKSNSDPAADVKIRFVLDGVTLLTLETQVWPGRLEREKEDSEPWAEGDMFWVGAEEDEDEDPLELTVHEVRDVGWPELTAIHEVDREFRQKEEDCVGSMMRFFSTFGFELEMV